MPRPMVGASERMRISRAGCAGAGGLSGDRTGNSGKRPLWQAVLRLHRAGWGNAVLRPRCRGQVCLPSVPRRISTPRGTKAETPEETNMAAHKLLLLPGDGIGPEVMGEVKRLIDWLNAKGIAQFETDQGLVGGSAYDAHKVSISEGDMAKAKAADAIIFGAVGGPKWDSVPYEVRPEAGLLRLGKGLGLFAQLAPAGG